jgi:hypothetical protein
MSRIGLESHSVDLTSGVELPKNALDVHVHDISKRATPRNGMMKPGNVDPAICALKLSGQILVGLAYTWSDSTRLLGHE